MLLSGLAQQAKSRYRNVNCLRQLNYRMGLVWGHWLPHKVTQKVTHKLLSQKYAQVHCRIAETDEP